MAHSPGSVYTRVLGVIQKVPSDRTDSEVEELLPFFVEKCRFFVNLKSEIVKDIIRNCAFISVTTNTVIIKQGDTGDCFYISLNGKVAVYINNNLSDQDDNEEEPVEKESSSSQSYTVATDLSKFGNCVASIPAGNGFGELALINKDCIRNASIIAEESADLVVVMRDLYNRSLKKPQQEEYQERVSCASSFPYFLPWNLKHKKQLAMSLSRVKFPFGAYIVKQGEPLQGLYFLIKHRNHSWYYNRGEAKIIVHKYEHEYQFSQYYPLPDPERHEADKALNEFLSEFLKPMKDPFERKNSKKTRTSRRGSEGTLNRRRKSADMFESPFDGSIGMNERRNEQKPKSASQVENSRPVTARAGTATGVRLQKSIDLCLIGPIEVIGELELSNDLNIYAYSVVCTESAEVFHLNTKNYDRLVTRRYPKTINTMRQGALLRLSSRLSRFPFNHIPLLTYFLLRLRDMEPQIQKQQENQFQKKARKLKESNEQPSDVPKFGALVDIFGPGTVFYKIRMRERAKKQRALKQKELSIGKSEPTDSSLLPNTVAQPVATSYDRSEDLFTPQLPENHRQTGRPYDLETSEEVLQELESKLKKWYNEVTGETTADANARVVPLRRFYVPDEDAPQFPKPGRTVMMRKKPLTSDETTEIFTAAMNDDDLE